MNLEIERKWLVEKENIPYELDKLQSMHISQSYLSFSPAIRVREIDYGKKYVMTVKTHVSTSNLARDEHEFEIPEIDYMSLLNQKRGNTVAKTRYINMLPNGLKEEIDVFEDQLSGLIYVEIEFEDEESANAYVAPFWYGEDVTEKKQYSNSSLAKNGLSFSK